MTIHQGTQNIVHAMGSIPLICDGSCILYSFHNHGPLSKTLQTDTTLLLLVKEAEIIAYISACQGQLENLC